MNNQRGGILSKLFIIPAGVVLMVGFFFLGYSVGKYQARSGMKGEIARPLPDIESTKPAQQEEFTFYKTLTDKGSKTVSIDLRPRPANEADKKQGTAEAQKSGASRPLPKDKSIDVKIVKDATAPKLPRQAATQLQTKEKQESTAAVSSHARLRYVIQLASHQDKGMAEEVVKKMKKRGYAAYIVSSELPGKGTWHRVRLGSFSNKTDAEKLLNELHAKEGISPIVVIE